MKNLTKTQKLVLLVAWLGWVFDVMDASLFAFTKKAMLVEMLGGEAAYKLNGAPIEGMIQTWFLIGWSLGGFIFGILADRWGRTRTLVVTILLYCTFTGLTGLCTTPEQVAAARFLTALGIGGEWAAGAALVAEVMPNDFRAKAASILQTAAAFGPMLGGLANLALKNESWRWMYLVGVFPALICFLLRLKSEAPIEVHRAEPQQKTSPIGPILTLFGHKTWRKHALIATVIGVVGVTGAGIAPFWLPNLVNAASTGMTSPDISARVTYATWCFHLGTLAGVFVFPRLCDAWGRKKAFLTFFLLAPVSFALALYGATDYTRILLMMPLVSFTTIGLSAGFGLYFPELFPPSLRATGAGLAYNSGRILSAPMPTLVGALVKSSNVAVALLLSAGIYLFGLLAIPFAPETKGKPLPTDD